MKSKKIFFWFVFCVIVVIFLILFAWVASDQISEWGKMTACREKYEELQIAEVLPYASESDPEKTSFQRGKEFTGFKIKFTQSLICNGKQVENVFMSGRYLAASQLFVPAYYVDHAYTLKNVSMSTHDGGHNVYLSGSAIMMRKIR